MSIYVQTKSVKVRLGIAIIKRLPTAKSWIASGFRPRNEGMTSFAKWTKIHNGCPIFFKWWGLVNKIRTFLFDIDNILEVAEFDRRMRYYLNEKGN